MRRGKHNWTRSFLDSGSPGHSTPHTEHAYNIRALPESIRTSTAGGEAIITHEADERISVQGANGPVTLELENSLVNHKLPGVRIVSEKWFQDTGHTLIKPAHTDRCEIWKGKELKFDLRMAKDIGLYEFLPSRQGFSTCMLLSRVATRKIWHERLSHCSDEVLDKVLADHNIRVRDQKNAGSIKAECVTCNVAKQKRQPIRKERQSNEVFLPGQCYAVDTAGGTAMDKGTLVRFLTITDHSTASGLIRVYRYKGKHAETQCGLLRRHLVWSKTQTGRDCQIVQMDNELINSEAFKALKDEFGFDVKVTEPYNSEMNPRAERTNGILTEGARAYLTWAQQPLHMAPYAMEYEVYIRNRLPYHGGQSRLTRFYEGRRAYTPSRIRVYGCLAYRYIRNAAAREKFGYWARPGTLLGIDHDSDLYLVMDNETKKVYRTRNVTFDEKRAGWGATIDKLLGAERWDGVLPPYAPPDEVEVVREADPEPPPRGQGEVDPEPVAIPVLPDPAVAGGDNEEEQPVDVVPDFDAMPPLERVDGSEESVLTLPLPSEAETLRQEDDDTVIETIRVSTSAGTTTEDDDTGEDLLDTEERRKVTWHGYGELGPILPTGKRTRTGMSYVSFATLFDRKLSHLTHDDVVHLSEHIMLANIEVKDRSVLKAEVWDRAREAELKALRETGTYVVVSKRGVLTKNPGARIIGSRFVHTEKTQYSLDDPKRYKARLVAQDYGDNVWLVETFTPTPAMEIMRFMIAEACESGKEVYAADFSTAYLNSVLDPTPGKEIYIRPPKGYGGEDDLWLLRKGLYGLKEAGRLWRKTITAAMSELGWTPLKSEPCLFYKRIKGKLHMALIHVDDLLMSGETSDGRKELLSELGKKFKIKDEGRVTRYCGVNFTYDVLEAGDTFMHQREYCEQVLARYGFDHNVKSVPTPGVEQFLRQPDQEVKVKNKDTRLKSHKYNAIIGELLWLARNSRPDISVAVALAAQAVAEPDDRHWRLVARILRYLSGTMEYGIRYRPGRSGAEWYEVYVDSNWAPIEQKYKSQTGGLVMLAGAPIIWFSRKQKTIAHSTAEAEIMAAADITKTVLWMRNIHEELGIVFPQPLEVKEDNQAAIAASQNGLGVSRRTRHIGLRYHDLVDQTEKKIIRLEYVPSEDNRADIFTKLLGTQAFQRHRDAIMYKANDDTTKPTGEGERRSCLLTYRNTLDLWVRSGATV